MISGYLSQLIICAIFLLILWIISKIVSNKGFTIKKNTDIKKIQIIDKQYIERNAALIIVKVEDELLLMGVTGQQISLIKKIEEIEKKEKL